MRKSTAINLAINRYEMLKVSRHDSEFKEAILHIDCWCLPVSINRKTNLSSVWGIINTFRKSMFQTAVWDQNLLICFFKTRMQRRTWVSWTCAAVKCNSDVACFPSAHLTPEQACMILVLTSHHKREKALRNLRDRSCAYGFFEPLVGKKAFPTFFWASFIRFCRLILMRSV